MTDPQAPLTDALLVSLYRAAMKEKDDLIKTLQAQIAAQTREYSKLLLAYQNAQTQVAALKDVLSEIASRRHPDCNLAMIAAVGLQRLSLNPPAQANPPKESAR
jgi:hypothetical protein